MLKRRLSVIQWISLCILIGGVVLVQIVSFKVLPIQFLCLECRKKCKGTDSLSQSNSRHYDSCNNDAESRKCTCCTTSLDWVDIRIDCLRYVRLRGDLFRKDPQRSSEGFDLVEECPIGDSFDSMQFVVHCGKS
jgi:hypothetical protein